MHVKAHSLNGPDNKERSLLSLAMADPEMSMITASHFLTGTLGFFKSHFDHPSCLLQGNIQLCHNVYFYQKRSYLLQQTE